MINLPSSGVMNIIFININWVDHERFPHRIIPYYVVHIFILSIWFICLIILLIKLCFYRNKELISLKYYSSFASAIKVIIIVQYFLYWFGSVYINTHDVHVGQDDKE